MNFLLMPSRSSMISFGALYNEKKYNGRLFRTDFTNVTRPPNERFLAFHDDSFSSNFFTTTFQDFRNFIFSPTGTPRYLKGKQSGSQFKKLAILDTSSSITCMPYNLLLKKLIFKPEAISKHLRSLARLAILSLSHSPRKITSSANIRCENVGPSFGREMPLIIFLLIASSNITIYPSIARIKRNGDSGSPCLTPLEMPNSTVGEPLTKTEAKLDFKHPLIQSLQIPLKFI
ncbi:hypothetical protein OROGR_026068 [Orobanche gracilis]